jgi:hypothetical protein
MRLYPVGALRQIILEQARNRTIDACFFSRRQRQESVSLRTIQFTQEQARDIAQVSPGDVRAWRKAVPYLAGKPGKAARFTFADLIGLAITSELTDRFGVRISDIGPGIDALFRALADAYPPHLEGLVALIGTASARLLATSELGAHQIVEPTFVVPCGPVLAQIGGRMMPLAPGPRQSALPFPPQILKAGR